MADGGDEYRSVADRQKSAQARVHSDLTDRARERLSHITLNPRRKRTSSKFRQSSMPSGMIYEVIHKTGEDVGYSVLNHIREDRTEESSHMDIISKCDTISVLAYIENLLTRVYTSTFTTWKKSDYMVSMGGWEDFRESMRGSVAETGGKVNRVLETEGILWSLELKGERFKFEPIGSELLQESDSELSVVAQDKKWRSVISPYNDAYNLYKDRKYGYEVPEKLYNSIEELARVICVDLEDWEDNRELNLSKYLDTMRENNVFQQNNIMHAEIEDLTNSMEKAFQKAGAERKNRHQEVGREYCTLMLHQVSAYLTYIIRSYESSISSS